MQGAEGKKHIAQNDPYIQEAHSLAGSGCTLFTNFYLRTGKYAD